MKKGLSVLLIAAALFGFYGGAVNLNDVLACKDYWEEAGEKSTANMNKLEDGLNQLKENEQAYLDGKDQVAEGEKALAEGEATLADGYATLAKGEADYAAAPAKLAAGEKALAEGKAALADGQDSINGLTKLINGIKQIRSGYNDTWRPGYEALKDGRNQLYEGSKSSKDNLTALAAFLDESEQAAYVAAVNDVAADDENQTAKDYKTFIASTNNMAKNLPVIQATVKTYDEKANLLLDALKDALSSNLKFAGVVNNQEENLKKFAAFISDSTSKAQFVGAVEKVSAAYTSYADAISKNVTSTITSMTTAYLSSEVGQGAVAQYMAAGKSQDEAVELVKNAYVSAITAQVTESVTTNVATAAQNNETLTAGVKGIYGGMSQIAAGLDDVNESVNGEDSALKNTLLPGLQKFNKAATADAVDALADGQNTISSGVATVASAVLGNSTLKAGVKKNFGSKAITLLNTYKSSNGPLSTNVSDFAAFEKQMDKNPGVENFLKKAQKLLAKTKAAGLKTLAAGKKKLAAGKATLAQGYADYAAAPAKLAAGRQQIADGEQALAEGRQALADGKAQLAQYEDGEQQVRDGLKTLTDTEADLDLESIADRLNGDVDFDNGDDHLELDEGLAAVEVGRGYKAEDGELITAEIMARAVGTGALLGAGVLAVLAAILSFLKKNKGAGVCAILAAAAGAFGAFYGTQAGTYFSSIAGSTVGATGWVAAGVLGAVALVHAIVHFTAKNA